MQNKKTVEIFLKKHTILIYLRLLVDKKREERKKEEKREKPVFKYFFGFRDFQRGRGKRKEKEHKKKKEMFQQYTTQFMKITKSLKKMTIPRVKKIRNFFKLNTI